MIEHHLSNPFANLVLGQNRTLKYVDTHLERLRARLGELPAAFAERVAATEAAANGYRQHVQTGATQGATRVGKTQTNDQAIAKFQKFVGQQAKILGALFTNLDTGVRGEDTEQYKQFFPQGVTAITRANKAELETEAAVFLKAAEDQQAQTGAALLARAQTLWQAVAATRKAQLGVFGNEKQTQDRRADAREALADALFLNLLTLLAHFHQQPERARDFFPEELLKENTGAAPATA